MFLLCCLFCFAPLLFCLPGPPCPLFLPLFCLLLLCAPLACSLPLWFSSRLSVALLWLAVLVPFLLPPPAYACVWKRFGLLHCRFPRYKIFLQFLVRRNSCSLTTGSKNRSSNWLDHAIHGLTLQRPILFLPWCNVKRCENVHLLHFALVLSCVCVKPARYIMQESFHFLRNLFRSQKGVIAGPRAYHQRRRSGVPFRGCFRYLSSLGAKLCLIHVLLSEWILR